MLLSILRTIPLAWGRPALLLGLLLASQLTAYAQLPGDGGTGGPPNPSSEAPGNGTTGGPPPPTQSGSVVLPVVLLDFTARSQGVTVALTWRTATEQKSSYFAVERSLNGHQFARVGTIAAAGNSSSVRTYDFPDNQVPVGAALLYYRLRLVDQDGSAAYSPVQSVTLNHPDNAPGFVLVPNPAPHAARLSGAASGAAVRVYDLLGRCLLATTADAAGTAALVLPAGVPAGVYLVRAGSGPAQRLLVE